MEALTIRRGEPSDAETLYAIHRESATSAYVHIFPPDRYRFPDAEMRAHWIASLGDDETDVVIAERGGRPVGFAGVTAGWLKNLFVVPDEWGRGAGTALHDEAVRLLRGKNAGARLWVLEENERARRFYERRGWAFDGERRPSDYPPYPPALRYALDLDVPTPVVDGSALVGRERAPGPIPNPHPPRG
ncbi:MAG TPA: GNAT family N-acetyltransferase [Gaiellaceae bacterium]|nr:GNAT family N-acetyltransferase [Gaiellaceae bacterium]